MEWEQKYPTPSHCLTELVQSGRIQFNLIGAFALRDKIRTGVRQAVTFARDEGNMSVRLISGDHIETASAVAEKVGIIKPTEKGGTYTVMLADEFEERIGGFDQQD
jgi:magnesium-transporting ATPase (P-type)